MNLKFRLILLIQASLLVAVFNCTGLNVAAKMGVGAVTNPAPEYANFLYLGDKRGVIFHKNNVAGQISNTSDSVVTGEACSKSILWLVAWGDSSIEAGKNAGGITKVASVEYEQLGVLSFLYHSFCTRVTGSTEAFTSTVESTKSVKKGR
jgi:hypothetical protein